jgi:hypothetical protein
MQRAVGPFDRQFEASRGKMSNSDVIGIEKL